jgi:type IV secretory pathway protease TraF
MTPFPCRAAVDPDAGVALAALTANVDIAIAITTVVAARALLRWCSMNVLPVGWEDHSRRPLPHPLVTRGDLLMMDCRSLPPQSKATANADGRL